MKPALNAAAPGRTELFLGFLKLGAIAFGGSGPITRKIVVEDRHWLDDSEFAALLGLCQALPGANTCNLALMLGDRFQGVGGAFAALSGLLLVPLIIVVVIGAFFAQVAHHPDVAAAVVGAAAASAGLAIGAAAKMALNSRLGPWLGVSALAVFIASALLRAPFVAILVILLPVSLYAAYRSRKP